MYTNVYKYIFIYKVTIFKVIKITWISETCHLTSVSTNTALEWPICQHYAYVICTLLMKELLI